MEDKKEIYWHLPGMCYFRLLNTILLNTMNAYPDKFRDGYKIATVYGTFPGAIWNGGRACLGKSSKIDVEKVIAAYNQKGIPVRFTWTNSLLEEKHVYDTYCNMIMNVANNGMNQVLVNTKVLEDYLRKEYPNFEFISSTTKRMLDIPTLIEELQKDYHLVVLDYDLNHNEEVLKALEPYADKLELLVNEICFPNCPRRADHYRDESRLQLEFDNRTDFKCPNKSCEKRNFEECKTRPAFISNEEISSYVDRGYRNFKIVGRGLPMEFVLDSYLYFLVKDEHREFIGNHIKQVITDLTCTKRTK